MTLLAEVYEWEAQIGRIQTMLSLWLELQEHWLYMEPIFSTEDIVMQMPTEGALFKVTIFSNPGAYRSQHQDLA